MKKLEIRLTNSMSGKKEVFTPRQPGKVSFYSCGPTVYGPIHIGNLRAALTSDLFFRFFKWVGYDVCYVRNYTDVDDRIIQQAIDEGVDSLVISKRHTQQVERDYALVGCLEPTHKTLVTEHIPEIIEMIQKIISNGLGYVVEGEVFFEISKFKNYGKLSRKKLKDLESGIRVEVDPRKRNPMDFSLWKPAKPGEPQWASPWGYGRPGWHIECSAMACKWLGPEIDLHHGGIDLVFPHHENEIAQSEGASLKSPYVGYWVHNAFLTLSQEKMSKSIGNVFLAKDFLAQFGGEVARYMLLSSHYRTALDFVPESLDHAIEALTRIYEAKLKALEFSKSKSALPDLRGESIWGEFLADCELTRTEFANHLAQDLNTAGAMAEVFKLIREFNRVVADPSAARTPSSVLGAQELIKILEDDLGAVIGIGRKNPDTILDDLKRIKGLKQSGESKLTETQILGLIAERIEARKAKNFARSDEIRNELDSKGVVIKDSSTETTWQYK